jgi:hypothetical protein
LKLSLDPRVQEYAPHRFFSLRSQLIDFNRAKLTSAIHDPFHHWLFDSHHPSGRTDLPLGLAQRMVFRRRTAPEQWSYKNSERRNRRRTTQTNAQLFITVNGMLRNDQLFAAAFSAAFPRARFAPRFPAASAAFFSAAFIGLVHRCPRSALSFLGAHSALLITFFNVMSFPLLLRSIFLFASSCHTSSV